MAFSLICGRAQSPVLVIPKGHTAGITSVCFSNDGKRVLTGSRDFTAKVWTLNAHEIQTYKLNNEVQAVAFSPGGDSVLTGSTDGKVKLWKITGELLTTFSGHKDYINAVAFAPDGKTILSGSKDGTAKLWDLKLPAKPVQSYQHLKSVTSVSYSVDGKSIITSSEDKTAVIWNLKGGRIQSFLSSSAIMQVRMSTDGKSILTGGADRTATLWNKKGISLFQMKHADKILACDISGDNQLYATASMDGVVKLWNASGKEILNFKAHGWGLSSIRFSPDGKSMITTCEDATIRQWDLKGHLIQNFQGHAQAVHSVCFSKDGNSIVTGCGDSSVKLWDIAGQKYTNIKGHTDAITSVAFSPDGQKILTGSEDRTAILWNTAGKKLRSFKLAGIISTVSFSPDGKLILTGCYNGCAKLWDTSGAEIKMFKQTEKITNAVFSPDGMWIATGSDDRVLKVYDISGKLKKSIDVYSQINSLTFTPDSKYVVTGNFNGLTQIWDATSGEGTQTLGGPGEEILSVAVSNDGNIVATGANDGTFKLWDLAKNEAKISNAHITKVKSIHFSPDGKTVATASADGTVRLWDVATGNEKLTMVSLDSVDWVVTNHAGLFDASPGAMQLMYYLVGLEVVELDQLKERFYEPGLLGSTLGITKSDRKVASTLTSVDLYPEIEASIQKHTLVVHLKERGGGIGKLSFYINNKEILENANPDKKTDLNIDLSTFNKYFLGDTNIISLRAYNNKSWLKSQAYDLLYSYAAGKGNEDNANQNEPFVFKGKPALYAIVVGTSDYKGDKLDLKFPDADAKAMANAIQLSGSKLFEDRVSIKLLTSNAKTADAISSKTNIENAFRDFSSKANAGDVLIAYFSGHGSTYGDAENSQFYYLTKDFASEDLSNDNDRINYTVSSNDLTHWLTMIPARKQVMIFDACHSGKVVDALQGLGARDLSPSQIRALDRMKDRTGMFILTGSAADKVSFEASQFGQGLLTYSLLQGMSGLALTDDKRVDVIKLFQYSRDKVPELAKGINRVQIPVVAFPKSGGSFDIGIVDATVKIPVAQAKPVFIRSTFMNMSSKNDSCGIGSALADYFNGITARGADAEMVYVDVNEYDNGYSINGFYTVKNNMIDMDGALFKGKTSLGDFKMTGSLRSMPEFIDLMIAKVSALIK